MGKKFIPNSDIDFKTMADAFARIIAADPARFAVTAADSELLSQAVQRYCTAFQAAGSRGSRSPHVTRAKNEARNEAKRIIQRLANLIRANDKVDPIAKLNLKLRERSAPKKSGSRAGLTEPPALQFVRALHEASSALPMHELKFRALDRAGTKAAGAVRLELFVDLVPPDEPVPAFPGANLNGRPWYLRSFTRSPIVLVPPMTRVPMRVVYWGRWADSRGEVGPFCKTAVGWIEGGTHHVLGPRVSVGGEPKLLPMVESAEGGTEIECRMLVLEAQYQSYNRRTMILPPAAMEAKGDDGCVREVRQLEGAAA